VTCDGNTTIEGVDVDVYSKDGITYYVTAEGTLVK